jgi:glycosyltransferase involved in cell wall biosynthesis
MKAGRFRSGEGRVMIEPRTSGAREGSVSGNGGSCTNDIVFVSTMTGSPWGGSEELWSRTGQYLVREGVQVRASVHGWQPLHERIINLTRAGIEIQLRTPQYSLWKRVCNRLLPSGRVSEVQRFLGAKVPTLAVFSDGGAFIPIGLLELCVSKNIPFVTISHVNKEESWPDDDLAARYRKVLLRARRCYFVSNGNRRLFEKQIGCELENSEVIRNPFNVDNSVSLAWPTLRQDTELRMACVARLHPPSKGQDVLLEALAAPEWASRPWRLTLYGDGPMKGGIERLVQRLGLQERVELPGFVNPVERIWAENHVLVMPSRYEGLPLAMVEAMFCARPVVATDVAGHSEIIDDGTTGFLADAPTVSSVSRALERLWARRMDLETIGKLAARSIRQRVPSDPVRVFAAKLKAIAGIG